MAKIEFECPECKKSNKIVIMGNDSGKFTRACSKCSSKIEIDIDSETKVQASLLEGIEEKQAKNYEKEKTVPSDYKKYSGMPLTGAKKKKNIG